MYNITYQYSYTDSIDDPGVDYCCCSSCCSCFTEYRSYPGIFILVSHLIPLQRHPARSGKLKVSSEMVHVQI